MQATASRQRAAARICYNRATIQVSLMIFGYLLDQLAGDRADPPGSRMLNTRPGRT